LRIRCQKCHAQITISFTHGKPHGLLEHEIGRCKRTKFGRCLGTQRSMNFTDRRTPTDKYPEWDSNAAWRIILPACRARSLIIVTYKNSRSQCENPVGSLEDVSKDPTAVFTTFRLIIVTCLPSRDAYGRTRLVPR